MDICLVCLVKPEGSFEGKSYCRECWYRLMKEKFGRDFDDD